MGVLPCLMANPELTLVRLLRRLRPRRQRLAADYVQLRQNARVRTFTEHAIPPCWRSATYSKDGPGSHENAAPPGPEGRERALARGEQMRGQALLRPKLRLGAAAAGQVAVAELDARIRGACPAGR